MADLTYPSSNWFQPSALDFGSTRAVRGTGISPLSVNEQIIELPYSHRWTQIVTIRQGTHVERSDVEGEVSRWLNPANRVLMWHLGMPRPRGTLTGSPTLNGAHSQGATTINIAAGGAGRTVARGDILGITTQATYAIQLVRVVVGGTLDGSGNGSVTIEPALRSAASSGAAITYNKPLGLWRPVDYTMSARYLPGSAEPLTIEFREVLA